MNNTWLIAAVLCTVLAGCSDGNQPGEQVESPVVYDSSEELDALLAEEKPAQDQTVGVPSEPETNHADMNDAPADAVEAAADPADDELKLAGVTEATLGRAREAWEVGKCYKCHGQDARGSEKGPDLRDSEWVHADGSIESIRSVIERGVTKDEIINTDYPFKMNPATRLIDDEQIEAIAQYLFSLQQP